MYLIRMTREFGTRYLPLLIYATQTLELQTLFADCNIENQNQYGGKQLNRWKLASNRKQ